MYKDTSANTQLCLEMQKEKMADASKSQVFHSSVHETQEDWYIKAGDKTKNEAKAFILFVFGTTMT